jgi:hypothetical protein
MPFTVTADYPVAVTLKAFFSGMTVALTLTGYGCNADRVPPTPLSPSPTVQNQNPAPNPPAPNRNLAGELWRLSTTIVSLEGGVCFYTWPVGKTFDFWTLSVERNDAQVRFVYDVNNPHDNLLFVGAVNDQAFTAASDEYRSYWVCSGSVTLSSSVVGSFSSDGRTLSGRERLTYRRVDGGGDLTITYQWSATRIEESATR